MKTLILSGPNMKTLRTSKTSASITAIPQGTTLIIQHLWSQEAEQEQTREIKWGDQWQEQLAMTRGCKQKKHFLIGTRQDKKEILLWEQKACEETFIWMQTEEKIEIDSIWAYSNKGFPLTMTTFYHVQRLKYNDNFINDLEDWLQGF